MTKTVVMLHVKVQMLQNVTGCISHAMLPFMFLLQFYPIEHIVTKQVGSG